MKKIIAFLALTLLLTGNNVFASTWNSDPDDCPVSLAVGNATTGVGINNGNYGCWTLNSVSASQGQIISLAVYYDNTSGVNQDNVRVKINQSTSGASNTHSFSGSLVSNQGGTFPLSNVTVNLSSSQTLTFNSLRWFPNNQNTTAYPLLNGQSGSEILTSSGLNIGTIVPTLPNSPTLVGQGSVIVDFQVGTTQIPNDCTITNFTANGGQTAYITSGQVVNLSWTTNDCSQVTVTGPNGNTISTNISGTAQVYPSQSGTYTINAYGTGGAAPTRSVYVNVSNINQNNCYINNFTANGSSNAYINYNDYVDLYWSTNGCDSVNISSIGSVNQSGNQTVYPYSSRSYTLTAHSYNGNTQTRTVYVNVNGNNGGGNNCYINNFTANGSSNAYINSGQAVSIVWNTTGCSSVSVTGSNLNEYSTNGYRTIYPTYSSTYRITAYGYNGSAPSQTIYVTVNPVIIVPPPVYNACAVTTVATNVTEGGATLNGLLSNSTGNSYFEYGKTVNLGSVTTSRFASGSFSEVISGLSPNTNYFFRFVSNCSGSLSYGKIETFRTLGNVIVNTPVRPIIVQGTTVVGTESPIMLKIENRYRTIGVGDIVDYTVTYKNIGKSKLTKPVLQVVVPKGITPTNSSAGTYQVDTNTLTVELQDFNPGDEGVTYLQGRVDSIESDTAQIVTTAILVYTTPNGAQENAIAYVLNSPKDIGNVLGASAFWSGLGSIGLIGWLLIIILILLIILLTRRYNKSVVHSTSPLGNSTTTTTHY